MSGPKPKDYTESELRQVVREAKDVLGLHDAAKRFAKDSIVTDAVARLVAQTLTEVHASRIEPLQARVSELERENGNLRAAFRANMLRYGPRENLDAEIDRVLNECAGNG